MAVGIFLSVLGLGGLCFLLVRSAVYALPVFTGLAAGFWAFDTGAGPIGAIGVGAPSSVGRRSPSFMLRSD
jgi:hypothetical protein